MQAYIDQVLDSIQKGCDEIKLDRDNYMSILKDVAECIRSDRPLSDELKQEILWEVDNGL